MKFGMRTACGALAVLASVGMSSGASAGTELLTNGNFNTGDFSGWTATNVASDGGSDGNTWTYVGSADTDNFIPYSGNYFLVAANMDPASPAILSQTFSDTANSTLTVSAWVQVSDTDGRGLTILIDGSPVIQLAGGTFGTSDPDSYVKLSGTFTATGSDTLSLLAYDTANYIYVGAISVQDSASSAVTGVPESSTWAMMLAGFAGLGFVGVRRKREARSAV